VAVVVVISAAGEASAVQRVRYGFITVDQKVVFPRGRART
jgi:hypothetical protein